MKSKDKYCILYNTNFLSDDTMMHLKDLSDVKHQGCEFTAVKSKKVKEPICKSSLQVGLCGSLNDNLPSINYNCENIIRAKSSFICLRKAVSQNFFRSHRAEPLSSSVCNSKSEIDSIREFSNTAMKAELIVREENLKKGEEDRAPIAYNSEELYVEESPMFDFEYD